MVMPSWQEIIDDIIEVLTLKHPALKDVSAISTVSIKTASIQTASINTALIKTVSTKTDLSVDYLEARDEMIDDMLDTLVVHKFKCGHFIKVPKYLYQVVATDVATVCQKCL